MSLRYTLGRFVLNFIRFEWEMTSLWRHFRFLKTSVHISILLNLQTSYLKPIHKNRMCDDVIMTSIKFSPNNCSYLLFYWSYKLHIWNQYITTQCPSNDKNESDLDGQWRSQKKVKGHKNELMVISRKLLHSQTSYLVSWYYTISDI